MEKFISDTILYCIGKYTYRTSMVGKYLRFSRACARVLGTYLIRSGGGGGGGGANVTETRTDYRSGDCRRKRNKEREREKKILASPGKNSIFLYF